MNNKVLKYGLLLVSFVVACFISFIAGGRFVLEKFDPEISMVVSRGLQAHSCIKAIEKNDLEFAKNLLEVQLDSELITLSTKERDPKNEMVRLAKHIVEYRKNNPTELSKQHFGDLFAEFESVKAIEVESNQTPPSPE